MPLGITRTPKALERRAVSCKIYPQFTHSICYWGVYIHFLHGGGDFQIRGYSTVRIFHGRFPWLKFPWKNFTRENLTGFLYEFFLIVLLSLCRSNFTCGDVPGELSGGNFEWDWIVRRIFP